ncbi:hypothetical protein ACP70R_043601 [Stipagrostis hirtigluma subsp. patula]
MASAVAASCRCSSVVFVGNIPYHATEEELRAACEEIGPVVSLRVATDRDTGRPRGFAFCEYLDDETALSACRNLQGFPLRGRQLRVGLADRASGQGAPRRGEDEPVGAEDATHAASLVASTGARPHDAVTAYLAGLSRRQVRALLDAVAAQGAALVERARREYAGLATLIEQSQVLLDMASAPGAAGKNGNGGAGKRKQAGGSPDSGQAQKLRKLEDGQSIPGVACR